LDSKYQGQNYKIQGYLVLGKLEVQYMLKIKKADGFSQYKPCNDTWWHIKTEK